MGRTDDLEELAEQLGLHDDNWTRDLRVSMQALSGHLLRVGFLVAEARFERYETEMTLHHWEGIMANTITATGAGRKYPEWKVRDIINADPGWVARRRAWLEAKQRLDAAELLYRAINERIRMCLCMMGEDWRNEAERGVRNHEAL